MDECRRTEDAACRIKSSPFSNSFIFLRSHKKKADGGKRQILELRCGVAGQTGWFAESVMQKCGSVQDFDLIVDTHQVHTKGSICEIWQHLVLKKLFANK